LRQELSGAFSQTAREGKGRDSRDRLLSAADRQLEELANKTNAFGKGGKDRKGRIKNTDAEFDKWIRVESVRELLRRWMKTQANPSPDEVTGFLKSAIQLPGAVNIGNGKRFGNDPMELE
jgi:hypothetical protein